MISEHEKAYEARGAKPRTQVFDMTSQTRSESFIMYHTAYMSSKSEHPIGDLAHE